MQQAQPILPNDDSYGLVYCTTNLVSGKKYIGKLTYITREDGTIKDRKVSYLGSSPILQKAIEKYGKINFTRETLQFCIDNDDLIESEKYWIDYFNATKSNLFYNIVAGGTGGYLGREAGRKIGEANRRRMLQSNWTGFKKGVGSKPYAHKISASKKGKPWSEIQRQAIMKAKKDKPSVRAKKTVQLELHTSKIIKIWDNTLQANRFIVLSQNKQHCYVDEYCRKNKEGVYNNDRKRNNKTGFSWMYLEDYERVYGKL